MEREQLVPHILPHPLIVHRIALKLEVLPPELLRRHVLRDLPLTSSPLPHKPPVVRQQHSDRHHRCEKPHRRRYRHPVDAQELGPPSSLALPHQQHRHGGDARQQRQHRRQQQSEEEAVVAESYAIGDPRTVVIEAHYAANGEPSLHLPVAETAVLRPRRQVQRADATAAAAHLRERERRALPRGRRRELSAECR